MAIGSDFEVQSNGNIRHLSGTTVYTVLQLHEWLQDLADDANAAGDDNVSILTANPSKLDGPRSAIKPMILNLINGFNIDDSAAQYINFGSISQDSGNVLYTGVKSIGSPLVAGSPVYIVQNASKLTSYWADGHIQIMVKGKTGGALIDNGDIRAFSRKYGQTYADFSANLVAGGEQPVAISTSVTDWTTLDEIGAAALSAKIAITVGDTTQTTGDANGLKLYKGTITLSGGCTVAEAAQYLQYICREASTTTINGELGWKYRTLNAAYTPNASAPFGIVAGGKWFVAQGWWIAGILEADKQKVQLVSHDGSTVTYPQSGQIAISGVVSGTYVLVGRDSGTGFVTNEYTLSGATTSGGNTCVMVEAIKNDTPDTGYLRVNGKPYTYTAVDRGTKTFTISGTWGQVHASSSPAWCPFIDTSASSTSISSASFKYVSDFTARVKARKGGSPSSLQPAEATFNVSTGTSAYGVIMNTDE
jgi:hypothetical protein